MLNICDKFHENLFNGFIVKERTCFEYENFQRGMIPPPPPPLPPPKKKVVLRFLLYAQCLVVYYNCTKFRKNIFNDFKIKGWKRFSYQNLQRGIIPPKNAGRVTVLLICIASDGEFYYTKISKISLTALKLQADQFSYQKISKGRYSAKM